VGLLSCS